ncbi:MAG: hypothetical protein M1818_001983 [Claussenomyces sp. TS43310]|nr:MAG: hypothetical protein M1818_001983 [Claussenomyces sp. TS43310]
MVLDPDLQILQDVAEGGAMDYAKWPELLPRVIDRLEQTVHNDFPPPRLSQLSGAHPPSSPPQFQTQPGPASQVSDTPGEHAASSQNTDKENTLPRSDVTAAVDTSSDALPPQILALVTSIIQTLTTYFTQYPPHTIQRLSELIVSPRRHYRTLPSYLHAVDRVVHVTSGANTYPLPAAVPDAVGAKILSNGAPVVGRDGLDALSWGTSTNTTVQAGLGSDESLGGALLTPIPWLRNQSALSSSSSNGSGTELEGEVKTESTETIDGPNGAGSIETVSVSVNGIPSTTLTATSISAANGETERGLRAAGGVTQGELLRQEQRAGVVPAAQLANNRGTSDGDGEDDEAVHARGPDEIGMEDMGPQSVGVGASLHGHGMQGIDVEAAVGRRAGAMEGTGKEDDTAPKREAAEDAGPESKRAKEDGVSEEGKDVDKELELVDADGKGPDDNHTGDQGETAGPDAVDTTVV